MSSRTTKTTKTKKGTARNSRPPQRAKTTTTRKTVTVQRRAPARRPHARTRLPLRSKSGMMSSLVRSIRDPFHYAPPLVGCGTNIPLTQASLFQRAVVSIPTASNMLIVCRGSNNGMINTYTQAVVASSWLSGTNVFYSSANSNSISTRFQTGRVISGGLKVRALAAQTAAPPLMMGGLFFDNLSDITNLTPTNTPAEQQLQAGYSLSNGLEVCYRAADVSSYTLNSLITNSGTSYSGGTIVPYMVVYIQNATGSALSVLIDALFHIEGNSGVDIGGDDVDESMASFGFTLDEVTRAGNAAGSIVSDRISAAGLMDSLVSAAASGARGQSLRSEGGLVQPIVNMPALSQTPPVIPPSADEKSNTEVEINARYVRVETETPPETPASQVVLSRSMFDTLLRK